jgi:NTE family protein
MVAPPSGELKVGLVLGAGGVLGGAWLVGALHALACETGWDPGSADCVVGTSAGAMIGALLACGVPPWYMVAHSAGEDLAAADPRVAGADRSAGARYALRRAAPPLGPGSWRLALSSLARPYRYAPATVLAGWLPRGIVSTEPLKDTIRRVAGDGWAPHSHLHVVACHYGTGERVAFGAPDHPAALADAVAASCAIPGFYHPVTIGGERYVDGGIRSTSNLDMVAGLGLDLVVCLNPMSSLHNPSASGLAERVAAAMRQDAGRRLGRERRRLTRAGSDVVLLQPNVVDLDAMGTNLMSRGRRDEVIRTAVQSVTEHLRRSGLGERLRDVLPQGRAAAVRRPSGPPSSWPTAAEIAAGRPPAVPPIGEAASADAA